MLSATNGVVRLASRSIFVIGARLLPTSRRCQSAAVAALLEPSGAQFVTPPKRSLVVFVLDARRGRTRVRIVMDSFLV